MYPRRFRSTRIHAEWFFDDTYPDGVFLPDGTFSQVSASAWSLQSMIQMVKEKRVVDISEAEPLRVLEGL